MGRRYLLALTDSNDSASSGGSVDAALAFRSYVPILENVEVVNISDDQNILIDTRYTPAADDPGANSFQAVLASDPTKQVLSKRGFLC